MRRIYWSVGIAIVVIFLLLQLNRPDFDRTPVPASRSFDAQMCPDAQIHTMLHKSCYNCHSDEGEIPWYAHIWPASQLLEKDMRQGRARLDFSDWSNLSPEMSAIRLRDACRMMQESKMPLWYYRPMHPGSVPSQQDVAAFCSWAKSLPLSPNASSAKAPLDERSSVEAVQK